MSEQILRPMSDGKRPAGNTILVSHRGSRNTFSTYGRHRLGLYYKRCGMKRPAKTRDQNRWRAFYLGQLIRRDVYSNSFEQAESLAIGNRLARKFGTAYRVWHITTGMIIGLFVFISLNSLSKPASGFPVGSAFSSQHTSSCTQQACGKQAGRQVTRQAFNKSMNPLLQVTNMDAVPADDTAKLAQYAPNPVSITGKVTESATSQPVGAAKIVLVNNLNAKRLDSAYTNTTGEYNFAVPWTNLPDVEYLKATSYPNPFIDKTNIELHIQSSNNYSLRAFDATGKLILNQTLDLKSGTNLISITGGKLGINIINITNGKETHTYKAIKTQGTDEQLNANVKITDPVTSFDATNTSSNGSLKSSEPNILNTGDYVKLLYTKEGFYDKDTVFVISPNQTINVLMNKIYYHTLNGTALSSNPDKQIKNNTQIYILTPESTDTTKVNTTNGTFTYSWTDKTPITPVKIGAKNVAGHLPNEITANIDDNESAGIMFNALLYSLSQPIKVKNQYSEAVSGAQVTGGDISKTTDATGNATITKSNLDTDINNLPLTNYALPLTVTKNNIQTLNQTINSNVGTNLEQLLNVVQNYKFSIFGTTTSPAGTVVKGWKDGTAIQTATVNGTAYETNQIEKTTNTFTLDSLTFEKAGYITFKQNNVALVEGANKKEATLQVVPTTHHVLIKPKTLSGDDIPKLTLDAKWADGTTTHHSVQADGYIHIDRTETLNPSQTMIITHVSDTAKYNTWQFFRTTTHNLADTNYAQNVKLPTEYLPIPGTPVKLQNIPDTLLLYIPHTKVATPDGLLLTYPTLYDDSIRMDNHIILGIMVGRSPPVSTTKFMPRPGAETIYIFRMNFNETTGAQISQTKLNQLQTEIDKILPLYTQSDGRKLLNYEFDTISSYNDPKWLAAQARDNFDNMTRSTFYDRFGINGVGLTMTYSINGKNRIKTSVSKNNLGNSSADMHEEVIQAHSNMADGPSGSIKGYTGNMNETISDLGAEMFRFIYIANQGTTTTKIQ